MFGLLQKVLNFLWNATVAYAASEQGAADLRGILDEAEADGIDVPFYEPSQPSDGEPDAPAFTTEDAPFVQSTQPARLVPKAK